MEDSKIIALLFARSEEALSVLQDRYGRLCHSIAEQITGNREDAGECVNDMLSAVWNGIPPASPDPLLPYVLRITRNIALHRRRDARAGKWYAGETVSIDSMREEGTLDVLDELAVFDKTDTDEEELREALNAFLAGLGRQDRILFLRRYWFEDPVPDIAERLGITENNTRVRLTRLKEKLRRFLAKEGILL